MQPKIISKFDINFNLTDYTKSSIQKIYELNGSAYYFYIHQLAEYENSELVFNENKKLVVLLHPKGLTTFTLNYTKSKWAPIGDIAAIPKVIMKMVINTISKK